LCPSVCAALLEARTSDKGKGAGAWLAEFAVFRALFIEVCTRHACLATLTTTRRAAPHECKAKLKMLHVGPTTRAQGDADPDAPLPVAPASNPQTGSGDVIGVEDKHQPSQRSSRPSSTHGSAAGSGPPGFTSRRAPPVLSSSKARAPRGATTVTQSSTVGSPLVCLSVRFCRWSLPIPAIPWAGWCARAATRRPTSSAMWRLQ